MFGSAIVTAILLSASIALASLPTVSGLNATSTSPTSVNLAWTMSSDSAVAGYKIYQNGSQIATVTPISAVSYLAGGLTPNTVYIFGVGAFNSAETASTATTSITTLSDATAPSVPVISSATPVSPNQINLIWSSSTDNVAVLGYKVYRDDGQIATTSGLSLADSGLATSTLYKYNVSAYDATGNVSATSSSVSATTLATSTPDTTAPTSPINLAANAVGASQINLNWTTSTDNIAVTGYKVYRNGNFISNSTSASYNDTGLLATTTYSYNVIAFDAAGNLSATSSTASATTLANGPIATTTAKIRVIGNGNDGRLINLRSNAKIKVVVYGGSSFNVKDIDRKTVTFAGAPAVNNWRQWHNRDRFIDRIFEFRARDMKDLIGIASTTATTVDVHFKATTMSGQVIDLTTTVKVKDLKRWKQDRQHEREEHDRLERLKEAKKKAEENARELKKKQQEEMKEQQEILREKKKQITERFNELKKATSSIIKNIKQEIKEVKNNSKDKDNENDKKGKNGNKKDD